MKLIALLCAAAVAATLTATATSASSAPARSDPWAYRYEVLKVGALPRFVPVVDILNVRSAVWTCQRKIGVPLTRPGLTPGDLHRAGHPFRAWVAERWHARLGKCRDLFGRTLIDPGDWTAAVNLVQKAYPGSAPWLMSCSSSEGGWGRWVPNTQGSGAGGWMQYMEGTFVADFRQASYDLTVRGFRLAPSAASWYSPLGQAVAGGWAFYHSRPSGKWTGYRC